MIWFASLLPWKKALVWLALVAAVVGGYLFWEHRVEQRGYDRADAMWQAREAATSAQALEEYTKRSNEAFVAQRALDARFLAIETARQIEEAKHEKAVEVHAAALRLGTERLSIATRTIRALAGAAPGKDAGPAAGPEPETRTDLMPEIAVAIQRIASDSAGLMRDYNAVIQLYGEAQAVCNK